MAVTESTLLSSFLLPPASLSVSLSLLQFTELFPKARQSDAVIPVLYRELQQQRAQEIARVRQNIASEAKRGEAQQRQIRRVRQARLHQELEEDGVELEMEAQLFPEHHGGQHRQVHTVDTLVPELEQACGDLGDEIANMEKDAQAMLVDIQRAIGDLSDIRYGRFSRTPGNNTSDLSTEVAEGLKRIQQLCDDTSKG